MKLDVGVPQKLIDRDPNFLKGSELIGIPIMQVIMIHTLDLLRYVFGEECDFGQVTHILYFYIAHF